MTTQNEIQPESLLLPPKFESQQLSGSIISFNVFNIKGGGEGVKTLAALGCSKLVCFSVMCSCL